MPSVEYYRKVPAKFADGTLTWDSPPNHLPFIGPYFQNVLMPLGATLARLVAHFSNMVQGLADADAKTAILWRELSRHCRNPRGYSFDAQRGYMRRPVNRMACNVLADLLSYARDRASNGHDVPPLPASAAALPNHLHFRLVCIYNEAKHQNVGAHDVAEVDAGTMAVCRAEPIDGSVRGNTQSNISGVREMQQCPGFDNMAACNAANLAPGTCIWVNSGCIPATARRDQAAPGYNGMAGAWRLDEPVPPGVRYVRMPAGRPGSVAMPRLNTRRSARLMNRNMNMNEPPNYAGNYYYSRPRTPRKKY